MVKDLAAPYDAGRRGAAWVKVKPVHTLDLVVLAVEWGSGRRRAGCPTSTSARATPATGGFVMLGKTFKGMTDEMLAWQTERFAGLAVARPTADVVPVRPEQVVEIAFDGVQRSTRYPGGVALRFARVVRYRDDKTAAEADTVEDVGARFLLRPRVRTPAPSGHHHHWRGAQRRVVHPEDGEVLPQGLQVVDAVEAAGHGSRRRGCRRPRRGGRLSG